ncbi:MAG TPA: hypothetical protein VHO25_21280 [Polyangiaceae bacterium]|nr:hypothetical protein [Polyangiaceae bacterium]
MSWARLACAAVVAVSSSSCAKALSDDDCNALLDRYTELLAKSQNAQMPAQRISELQERARELARNEPAYEFADCAQRVSRRHFECAMQAPSVDEMERCLIF